MVEIENFYVFRGVSSVVFIFCCIENNKSTTAAFGIFSFCEKRSGVNKIVYNINTDFLVFPLFPFYFSTPSSQRIGRKFLPKNKKVMLFVQKRLCENKLIEGVSALSFPFIRINSKF